MSSHQCPTGTEDTLSVALLQLIYLSIHRLYIIMRSPSSRSRRLYDSSRTIVSRDTLLSGSPDPPLSLTFKNLETWATTSECICRSVNARKCYVLPTRLIQIQLPVHPWQHHPPIRPTKSLPGSPDPSQQTHIAGDLCRRGLDPGTLGLLRRNLRSRSVAAACPGRQILPWVRLGGVGSIPPIDVTSTGSRLCRLAARFIMNDYISREPRCVGKTDAGSPHLTSPP